MKVLKWFSLLVCSLLIGNSLVYSQDKEFQSFLLKSYIENKSGYKTELPIIKNLNNFTIINVAIDGKNLNFIFDTGTMISLISEKAVGDSKKLKKIALTDGNGKKEKVNTLKKDIELNNVKFKEIGFAVIDFEHLNKYSCIQIDGILGANAIRLCNWQINYSNKTLKLSDEPFSMVSTTAFDIELKFHNQLLPLLDLNYKGDNFLTLLDTGYNNTLSINKNFYSTSKQLKGLSFVEGNGVFSGTYKNLKEQEVKKVVLDTLRINSNLFTNIKSYITDEKPLIGYGFLKDYITTINIETKKLYLEPLNKNINIDFDFSFTYNKKNELIIAFVWNNSQLKKDGIEFGDKIIKFNGKDIDKINKKDYCDLKESLESKNKLEITVLKDKKEFSYTIMKN